MKIHYLRHVPFEGSGCIAEWNASRKHILTATKFYENDYSLPKVQDFDSLIIMGGPMNVDETRKYPWLAAEKKFIQSAIEADKTVIGICLGAQLIARALGAKVLQGQHKEIGWFPVDLTSEAAETDIFRGLPSTFTAFHWHGDVFDIPSQALPLASSQACKNQAFLYGEKTLALQFHLEATPKSVRRLVENCEDDIVPGKYIQKKEAILSAPDKLFSSVNKIMETILNNMNV